VVKVAVNKACVTACGAHNSQVATAARIYPVGHGMQGFVSRRSNTL